MTDLRRLPRQGGFLLILGAILITLGALFAVVATFMAVTRSESAVDHLGSGQALFLAESGRAQALRALIVDERFCSQITYGNVSLGAGTFTAVTTSYKAETRLSSGITSSATVIPLLSVAGLASHGRVLIDSEWIDYAGIGSTASDCSPVSAPCLTGARRGVAGTAAASHIAAANYSTGQELCLVAATASASGTGSTRTVHEARQIQPAIMVYSKAVGDTIPYYRLWNGSSWGPERQALAVTNGIRYMVVKMARTRNEAILVTQDSGGRVDAQIWNGASWDNFLNLTAAIAGADLNARGFDVVYETARDRALIAYNTNAISVSLQIWAGAAGWVSAGTQALPGAIGTPRWIRLAANPLPTSNDVALITLTSATGVYGMLRTGDAWSAMGQNTSWDIRASTNAKQAVGVAYESLSGETLFAWGTSVINQSAYRTWTGVLSSISYFTSTGLQNDIVEWIQLTSDPRSDRILYGAQSFDPAIIVRDWNGSSFQTTTTMTTTSEDAAARNFDLAFETAPNASNRAWIVFGDANATGSRARARRGYIAAGNWSWAANTELTTTDDTGYVRVVAHPRSGSLFAALYQDATGAAADDLVEMYITDGGSTWSAANLSSIWTGATLEPARERVDIGVSRYLPRIDWMEIFQ